MSALERLEACIDARDCDCDAVCGLPRVKVADLRELIATVEKQETALHAETERGNALAVRVAELEARINTPEIFDFIEGMKAEAAHQRERWAASDGGKTDADWFWLVGYLSGKALHKSDKRLHHLITVAAALFNWHLATVGKTDMRPGIATPDGVSTVEAA